MLTGEGLLAKVVVTIVGRAASSIPKLTGSKRLTACRMLTRVYYATVSLDEVTANFLRFASSDGHSSRAAALLAAVNSFGYRIERPSYAFLELARDLREGLMIIDPVLAKTLAVVSEGKGDFLSFLSCCIFEKEVDGRKRLYIEIPNDQILATDFYSACSRAEKSIAQGRYFSWPEGVFDYFRDFEAVDLLAVSEATAKSILSLIEAQHLLLQDAREALRSLLAKYLTVEELLYLPRRENSDV